MSDTLTIAGRQFHSRLFVGTGKYRSFQEMARAHTASGADMVTVAVRRVNLTDKSKESLLDFIPRDKMFILPNTAACYTADEAIRTARLGRECGLSNWVKLEVIPDPAYLLPDPIGTLQAAETLVAEGFVVLPYIHADPVHREMLTYAEAASESTVTPDSAKARDSVEQRWPAPPMTAATLPRRLKRSSIVVIARAPRLCAARRYHQSAR